MIYNQDITLDLNTNTSYLVVGAKQGDNIGRTLTATILENGEPFRIPETTKASYRIRKPDGEGGWNSAEIYPLEHKVVITLTAGDLSTSGRCYADILLTVGTTRIGTVSFIIDVQAAPNIVEGALASEAFGYLYDMVDQAGSIIESSQAWAEGKRSTDDVLGDSYSIYSTRGLDVSLDFETFKSTIDPPSIGKTTVYSFTYTSEGWEYGYNNELIDMSELGFTIVGNPDRGDLIEVTASFADPAWHNNSLYYRQRAEAWAVGTVDGTDVKDIYDLWHTDGLIVDFNYDIFKQVHPLVPGETETYTFNYKNGNWQYNNQNVNMPSLGFTITAERLTNDAKIIVTTSDDTYKNNAKFYKEVIKNSRVGSVTTADPGKPAQVSATFHVDTSGTDDAYEFDFTLPSIHPHATIDVDPLPEDQAPTAAVQVHELSAEEIAEKKALPDGAPGKIYPGEEENLQKSFDFTLGIPKGVSAGFADDMSVVVNNLDPGTNATATVQVIKSTPNTAKQFKFTFGLPTGATGKKGDQGEKGYKGDKGDQGEQGPKGDTGDKGDKGDQGIQGPRGPEGPQGATGQKGDTGATGLMGAPGRGIASVSINNNYQLVITYTDNTSETIPTSIRGPQGEQGIQGPKGDQGLQGVQGLQGPQGVQGPQGQTGTQGTQGNAGTNSVAIQIGSVTEAATGSGPSITATPDPDTGVVTLDFVLPTGAAPITIDDTTISIAETWSSSKISSELGSISSDVTTLQNQVAASTTGLLDRTTALESSTNSLSGDVATLKNEVETPNTGLLSRTTVLETAVGTLQTEVEHNVTGVMARTTALETAVDTLQSEVEDATTGLLGRMTTLEIDVDALESNIPGLSSRIGTLESVVGNEELTGSVKKNINDIHTQIDGSGGIMDTLSTQSSLNASYEHSLSRYGNILEGTSGLVDRTAALESTIQTKQPNLTFANNNGNLIIALAV